MRMEITGKPIIMSTPMVKGIISMQKTVTRRLSGLDRFNQNPDDWMPRKCDLSGIIMDNKDDVFMNEWTKCPYNEWVDSSIGGSMYVRESFHKYIATELAGNVIYSYKADNPVTENAKIWKPSIHMPKEACRLQLQINDFVRIERIADITIEDSIREGVEQNRDGSWRDYVEPDRLWQDDARGSFISLWEHLHGKPKPVLGVLNKLKRSRKNRYYSHYTVYCINDAQAAKWEGKNLYKGLPLKLIVNPWVWRIPFILTYKKSLI